jgi:hypothetical protein
MTRRADLGPPTPIASRSPNVCATQLQGSAGGSSRTGATAPARTPAADPGTTESDPASSWSTRPLVPAKTRSDDDYEGAREDKER